MKKLGRQHEEPTQPKGVTAGGLSVSDGGGYNSRYPDDAVEQFAEQDGKASMHDASVWGQNADQNRVVEVLLAAHRALLSLIAHRFRGDVLDVHEELEQTGPQVKEAEQTALDAVDEHGDAEYEHEENRQRNKDEDLAPPSEKPLRSSVAVWLMFLLADLGMLASANQLFGLSDRTILGIPYTDELHLSAFGSILALLLLAHFAGGRIRGVLHAVGRRRKETDPAKRASLPEPDLVSLGVAAAELGFAVVLLIGTSAIRSDFLAARGVDAQSSAFFEIQLGILAAATAFSIAHAHPYGRAWAASQRRVRESTAQMLTAVDVHVDLVGRYNRLIDRAGALLAQAGHHCAISTADVERQLPLYMRRVQFSQPEPVTQRLFAKATAKPTQYVDKKLLAFLIGITELPKFEHLDTDRVNERREHHRQALQTLREHSRDQPGRNSKITGGGTTVSLTTPPPTAVRGNGGGH